MKKLITVALSVISMVALSGLAVAGSLDSPGAPSAGSGMYTLQNLYDYLTSGTALTIQNSFQEPTSGPGPTMKSTKQIGDDVKALFNICDATGNDVRSGKKFFCTQPGSWGVRTGTISDRASDDMFLDIISDADGANNTIDTGNTTATFDTNYYTTYALPA